MKKKNIILIASGILVICAVGFVTVTLVKSFKSSVDVAEDGELVDTIPGVPYEDKEKQNEIKEEIVNNSETQNQSMQTESTLITIKGQEQLYKHSSVENVFNLRVEFSSWLLALDSQIKEATLDLSSLQITDTGYIVNATVDRLDDTITIECDNGKYTFK